MAISESQKKAVRKYNAKAYDRLEITVAKGRKDVIKAHAAKHEESLNSFVNRAIDETMERETLPSPPKLKRSPKDIMKDASDRKPKNPEES
jgi:hypothetical protein